MAKLDLTLREAEEAKSYGLTPDQYDDLKAKFEKRLRDRLTTEVKDQSKKEAKTELRAEISTEMRPTIRADVEKEMRPKLLGEVEKELRAKLPDELKPKLREEVLPDVRKQVGAELGEKTRTAIRADLEREYAERVPNTKDRAAFKEFIREAEIDCLTQGTAASNDFEKAEASLLWSRRVRLPFACLLFIGLPILGFFLYQGFATGPGFWTFLIAAIGAAIAFAVNLSARHERLIESIKHNKKVSSDYWVLAEAAKRFRVVTAECSQKKGELDEALTNFTRSKRELDDRYWPNARALETARGEVRSQLMSEVDPDRLLRVADSNIQAFEELEAEADMEPAVGVRKRA